MNLVYIFLVLQIFGAKNQPTESLLPGTALFFTHKFGGEVLALDNEYSSSDGYKITLTKFKYYLANIEFRRKDGSVWKHPQQYHLIEINDETSPTIRIDLEGIPRGEYTKLSFSIGVDSILNHSGSQEGVLDPDYGMFWMWETGYVFFKTEGFYHNSGGAKGAFVFHVGRDDCYRTAELGIPSSLSQIPQEIDKQIHITADVEKLFTGFSEILKSKGDNRSISVMGGPQAVEAANDFIHIFSIKR